VSQFDCGGASATTRLSIIARIEASSIILEVQTVPDIRNALPFPLDDLEEIADLEPGTLGAPVQTRAEPVLKAGVKTGSGGNVVRLFDKKT
jgi:hypothetical protein